MHGGHLHFSDARKLLSSNYAGQVHEAADALDMRKHSGRELSHITQCVPEDANAGVHDVGSLDLSNNSMDRSQLHGMVHESRRCVRRGECR